VFRGLAGISGLGDFLGRLVIALVISSAIALIGVASQREESVGRAVFVVVAGIVPDPVRPLRPLLRRSASARAASTEAVRGAVKGPPPGAPNPSP
jgi:hypothetical protein